MTARISPEPDHFATCPVKGKILDYYAGTFEAVFVLFHPFIRPVSISVDGYKTETFQVRASLAATCQAVAWAEVSGLTGLPSYSAIDIGLRTSIGALNQQAASPQFAEALELLEQRHGIVAPCEGRFSDLLHDLILDGFQRVGHQWAWVGDEFGTQRTLYWIDDLKTGDRELTDGTQNIFAADKSLLYTTHWDSHFSFLCGSQSVLETLVNWLSLEGFFCTPDTGIDWSLAELR